MHNTRTPAGRQRPPSNAAPKPKQAMRHSLPPAWHARAQCTCAAPTGTGPVPVPVPVRAPVLVYARPQLRMRGLYARVGERTGYAWYGRLGTGTLPKTWVHLWTHVPSGKCGMSTYSKIVFLCGTTQRTVIINYTVLYSTEQSVWYLGFPKAKERECV